MCSVPPGRMSCCGTLPVLRTRPKRDQAFGACIRTRRYCVSGIPAIRTGHGRLCWLDHPDHLSFPATAKRRIYCGNRQRDFSQAPANLSGKTFIVAPTAGEDATCRSCAHCPWMAMNSLESLRESLSNPVNAIKVAPEVAQNAMKPLTRMLNFAEEQRLSVRGKRNPRFIRFYPFKARCLSSRSLIF